MRELLDQLATDLRQIDSDARASMRNVRIVLAVYVVVIVLLLAHALIL